MTIMRVSSRTRQEPPVQAEQDRTFHMQRSVIRSVGSYLPQRMLTNAELATMVDTSDEWIVERTGIRQRHIAAEGEFTSHLAVKAAQAALDNAGMAAGEIDLIVLATSTPDQTFPATAATVQAELGITQGDDPHRGILATRLRSDGRYRDKLYVDGGPSSTQTVGHLRMEGREVFKHAVTNISDVMGETLDQAGFEPSQIDLFVPHQANRRILDGTARKFGLSTDKVVITVDLHGNTSAASIPLALDVARHDGRLRDGSLVLMEAMGGGFTWGAVLARW
jgi:3-oxoacyl-[acyl-carrier-protein] synthase-3